MASLFNPSELYSLLAQYGGLPQWAQQRPFSGSRGEYIIDENRVIAPPEALLTRSSAPSARSTLSHEMSHAVQHQLFGEAARKIQNKKLNKEPITPEEDRFLTAAQKMYVESFGKIGQVNPKQQKENKDALSNAIKRMYTGEGEKGRLSYYDEYRTSPKELQSFGIGRFTAGGNQRQGMDSAAGANPHLDPSFATEFAILAELFKSLPQDVKSRRASKDEFIKEQRKAADKEKTYDFENITSDPFKPTLK